jgi:hypothetical protein
MLCYELEPDLMVLNSSIGVDYKAKEVDIDGEIVKLQVWSSLALFFSCMPALLIHASLCI